MTAGTISLPTRSSSTRCSILHKAVQLAYVHTVPNKRQTAHSPAEVMLAKARKAYEANPPAQKQNLAKQLFPSSSPTPAGPADIREQFKRPGTAAASARMEPYQSQSSNTSQPSTLRGPAKGSLASLYGGANSFSGQSGIVDLTGSDSQAKMKDSVYFAEDDFSDDENLDLDYEAPSALPAGATTTSVAREAKENVPPPTTQEIPWSSSPASHFFAAKPRRLTSETTTMTEGSLKRDSSGEGDFFEAPPPKKAKRRVLPASFRREPSEEADIPALMTKTPASKAQGFWDPTASAIKEQKRQLKNLRQPQKDKLDDAQRTAAIHEAEQSGPGKVETFSLSSEQKRVLDLVVNKGASVFFTGPAGTGKSVLMRAIIAELKKKFAKDPERVAVTASTGLAACNIGGMTLHSFSGIGLGKEDATQLVKKVRRNPKVKNRWLRTKYLIIDEVSMCDGELFDKLSQIGRIIRNNGRPWGGIQLVITGDFFQLPPVPDGSTKREIKFAFEAATWSTSIDHTIGLTQVFRQRDPTFANMLNEMRLGKITPETERSFKALARPLSFNDGIETAELYPTRNQVEGSNAARLNALPGKAQRYESMDTGDPQIRDRLLANMMAPKSIELKINAQVMLIKNLDDSLVNGSLGKVVAFSDERTFEMTSLDAYDSVMDSAMAKARQKLKGYSRDPDLESTGQRYPVVQFTGVDGVSRTILCQPEDWKVEQPNGEIQAKRSQLPLILAWALSIHKAQGQTLERVTVNLGKIFEKGQAYVALSRATSQAGLQVLGFNKSKVMAHPRVINFYNQLYTVEEASLGQPAAVSDFITNRKGIPKPPEKKQVAEPITLDDDEEAAASFGYY